MHQRQKAEMFGSSADTEPLHGIQTWALLCHSPFCLQFVLFCKDTPGLSLLEGQCLCQAILRF